MGIATKTKKGIEVLVKVSPRSSKSGIIGEHDGRLKICLNSPPVNGAANDELIKIFAKWLGIAKSNISLASGSNSRTKTVLLTVDSQDEIYTKLAEFF